jgi:thiol-disulfide isomerase/thioredoxin
MSLIRVNEADFTDELVLTRAVNKGGLLVAKTNWCIYCKKALPELQLVAKMLGNAFTIYSIDGDENPDFMKRSNVIGFPTIFNVNKDGSLGEKFNDTRDSSNILKFICRKSLVCVKK